MQWEAGRHPAPSWVPALRAGPGARSQNPAVGICCVYLQSNSDPGTVRRMSQLPVQGRILHQASQFKNHHLEMQQLNNFIKLALLTSDRLKPFHTGTFHGKQQSPQTIFLQESLPKPGICRLWADGTAHSPEELSAPTADPKELTHTSGAAQNVPGSQGHSLHPPLTALPWGCRGARRLLL